MMQSPGMGGKAGAPQGKQGASQGKQGAPQGGAGKQGAQGGPPPVNQSVPGQDSGGVLSPAWGNQPGAGMYGGPQQGSTQPGAQGNPTGPQAGQITRDFPMFTAQAQGFQGASADQQNPNTGGASTSPSALTSPSTSQGGMT